jgi:hypothetical protein
MASSSHRHGQLQDFNIQHPAGGCQTAAAAAAAAVQTAALQNLQQQWQNGSCGDCSMMSKQV